MMVELEGGLKKCMAASVKECEGHYKVTIGDHMYSIVRCEEKDAQILASALFGNAVTSVAKATVGEVHAYKEQGFRINYIN